MLHYCSTQYCIEHLKQDNCIMTHLCSPHDTHQHTCTHTMNTHTNFYSSVFPPSHSLSPPTHQQIQFHIMFTSNGLHLPLKYLQCHTHINKHRFTIHFETLPQMSMIRFDELHTWICKDAAVSDWTWANVSVSTVWESPDFHQVLMKALQICVGWERKKQRKCSAIQYIQITSIFFRLLSIYLSICLSVKKWPKYWEIGLSDCKKNNFRVGSHSVFEVRSVELRKKEGLEMHFF